VIVNSHPQKKDEEISADVDQAQIENSSQEERVPEYDELGTALNGI